MNLQEFIAFKLRKEEGTVAMIKVEKSFHQRHIFVKMANPLLVLLRMDDSNQPHMDKLWFMFLMIDVRIRISMPELNDEYYFPPASELEGGEYEEGHGDDNPPEYLSDDEDVSNNEDSITSQDNNQLGWEILAVWERYKPL